MTLADGARALASAMLTRADSWVNAMTGLGTLRDKLVHSQIGPAQHLADQTLEHLYNGDHLAAKIVDKIPKEATRRGFCVGLEGIKSDESARTARDVEQRARALQVLPGLRQSWIWGRLYGAGALFVGADDGQTMDQPLNESAIRSIRFLTPLCKPQLSVHQRYTDVEHPRFNQPELFEIHRSAGAGVVQSVKTGSVIHESRLIMFGGTLGARFYSVSPDGFEDSVLQRVHTQLRDTATAFQSTGHLLSDASQGVLKIADLMNMISAGRREDLRTRVEMMDMARSVCRAILVDADRESFERIATSFAGVPDVLDRMMQVAAAAAEMPVTILWGRSPAGMNATGESDTRGWYDTVQDAQQDVLRPRLERALTLLMLSKDGPTRGALPDSWEVKFNPLWQPTAVEEATRLKTVSETYATLVREQIMLDVEAALGLARDFPSIDVGMRQRILKDELQAREERAGEPPDDPNDPDRAGNEPDDDDDDEE